MGANSYQIQAALHNPYDRILFSKEVLSPVFGAGFTLNSSVVPASVLPNKSEKEVIETVTIYGNITLEDYTEITCYEIVLQPKVRIEQSKVAIQRYVRKLLTAGQAALVNFITPQNKNVWRLTLVAKDSVLTETGIKEKTTYAKRYTYLLGPNESCKTAAERFEALSTEAKITFKALVNAFSVEKLSEAFFEEYTLHYEQFVEYLNKKGLRSTVFKGKDKAIRDFVKKLLGRIVFLYFVQKKGWLGASDLNYKDGMIDFMRQFFKLSGGDETFYSNWLTVLFFETLNKERTNDDFKMPDGKKVKVPFLNGGLFDREEYDEPNLAFNPKLFHNPDFEDVNLTEKIKTNSRGFLDFLNSFNFTVYEDSPDDHTVAVDPEMLGHIFENLLEDNKDKGTFYTPKKVVHYMCQESLSEYIITHLSKEYTIYKELGNAQIELIGEESKFVQLKLVEQLGEKALNYDNLVYLVKHKLISRLTHVQLIRIDQLLDAVKICDPAIGSGAFPMGLLQEIFTIKEAISFELNTQWKPAEVKEGIIQSSIYGVDIEKGAVDIARLRFWLSLVVDEEKPRALPNLDYKIVVGDSLVSKFENEIIEIDWDIKSKNASDVERIVADQQVKLHLLQSRQALYFGVHGNKEKLKKEIELLKAKVLINQLILTRKSFQQNNPILGGFDPTPKELLRNANNKLILSRFEETLKRLNNFDGNNPLDFFDWKLNFPEIMNEKLVKDEKRRGFDIVIANPPYIDSETMVSLGNEDLRSHLTNKLPFCKGNWDIYIAFFSIGYRFLNSTGNLAYISPDKWISKPFGYELRKGLLNKYIKIAEAGREVFRNAKVDSIITFIGKYDTPILQIDKFKNGAITNIDTVNKKTLSEPFAFDWLFSPHGTLLKYFDSLSDRFSKYGVCENACATSDAYKLKEFLIDISPEKYDSQSYMKVVNTGTISKYVSRWGETEMTYLKDKKNPTKKYKYLTPVVDKKKFLKAFGNSYSEKSIKPKIIIKGLTLLDGCLDIKGEIIPGKSTLIITKDLNKANELFPILTIINSKLPLFYIREKYRGSSYNQGVNFNTDMINELPIPLLSSENISILKVLAEYILFLKKFEGKSVSHKLMPTYFEQIIDGIVYELYFCELLKHHKREIIKHIGELPEFSDKMSSDKKMNLVEMVFDRLNERGHPIRVNLFYMNSIPEIAIIEGRNENN